MARKKNLAGLAALAGLAYVASRDKATKGGAPVVDAPAAVPGTSKAAAEEMDPMEAANNSPVSQKIMDDMMAAGNEEKGGRMLDAMRDAESAPKRRSKPAAGPRLVTPEEGSQAYRSRAQTGDPRFVTPEEGAQAYRSRAGTGMKKGGSVKGWGIARGSRKAKTY